jgi:hypothetical protein
MNEMMEANSNLYKCPTQGGANDSLHDKNESVTNEFHVFLIGCARD